MPSPAILLGLLAAITWGAADFAGGLATRRAAPSRVVLIAHGLSLALLALVSRAMPAFLPPGAVLAALLSGIAGGLALMLFYEALALGAMGLSAAIAGLLTAVLPVILAIHTQGAPQPLQVAGFAVAAAAIVLIAYAPAAPGANPTRKALLFAVMAGCGFGFQLVWLHSAASRGASAGSASPFAPVLRALMLSRMGGTAVALLAQIATHVRKRARLLPGPAEPPPQPVWHSSLAMPLLAALAGLLDTSGNLLYMLSSLSGRLDVAAVLSSLYPGATIVLAALILHERATRLQAIGMGFALLAVALIAA